MPEYYQVLKTAIDALERSDEAEQRRNIYGEARNTLIAELRAVSPPLNPADISRRRLELEEAIRKVERELASNTTHTPLLHDVPSVSEGTRTALPPEMANAPPDSAPEDVFRRAIQAAKNYGILNGSPAAVLAKHEPARTPEQDGAATTVREWLPAGDEARPAKPRLLASNEDGRSEPRGPDRRGVGE